MRNAGGKLTISSLYQAFSRLSVQEIPPPQKDANKVYNEPAAGLVVIQGKYRF